MSAQTPGDWVPWNDNGFVSPTPANEGGAYHDVTAPPSTSQTTPVPGVMRMLFPSSPSPELATRPNVSGEGNDNNEAAIEFHSSVLQGGQDEAHGEGSHCNSHAHSRTDRELSSLTNVGPITVSRLPSLAPADTAVEPLKSASEQEPACYVLDSSDSSPSLQAMSPPAPTVCVPCPYSDLPRRYRNVSAYYCTYCTYTVCESCYRSVPTASRCDGRKESEDGSSGDDEAGTGEAGDSSCSASTISVLEEVLAAPLAPRAVSSPSSTGNKEPHSGSVNAIRCHLCHRGNLVKEELLLHEWSCEGPMPEDRLRRKSNVAFDMHVLELYHHMREKRNERAMSTQRLTAEFHGWLASPALDRTTAYTMGSTQRILRRHRRRPPCCVEGGAFVFSIDNPRLQVSCVWCAVNRLVREACYDHLGEVSITPLFTWQCPPSLSGLPARRYRVDVPYGAYGLHNVHALALYMTSDIFQKSTTQLAAVEPVGRARRQPQGLTTVKLPPSSVVEPLLVVEVLHHIATSPFPLVGLLGQRRAHEPLVRASTSVDSMSHDARVGSKRPRDHSIDLISPEEPCHVGDLPSDNRACVSAHVQEEHCSDGRRSPGTPPAEDAGMMPVRWPDGLHSEELVLIIDYLLQGRSVAVYGLASKFFFLGHVARSAELLPYGVATIDGSGGAQSALSAAVANGAGVITRQLDNLHQWLRMEAETAGALVSERQRYAPHARNDGLLFPPEARTPGRREIRSRAVSRSCTTVTSEPLAVTDPSSVGVTTHGDTVAESPLGFESPLVRVPTVSGASPMARVPKARVCVTPTCDTGPSVPLASPGEGAASPPYHISNRGGDASPEERLPSTVPKKRLSTTSGDGCLSGQGKSQMAAVNATALASPKVTALASLPWSTERGIHMSNRDALQKTSELQKALNGYNFHLPQISSGTCTAAHSTASVEHQSVYSVAAPCFTFLDNRLRQKVMQASRAHARRCVQWLSPPSTTILEARQERAKRENGNDEIAACRAPLLPHVGANRIQPTLLVVHNVDQLPADAMAQLQHLCRVYGYPKSNLLLLISFDDPQWPLSSSAAMLQSMHLAHVELRSLLLPRAHELCHLNLLDVLTEFEAATAAGGGKGSCGGGGAGGGGASLPLLDTIRRVLFSLPPSFTDLLKILASKQEAVGEGRYVSIFSILEHLEENGMMVSSSRMKALQQELTSNRLAIYDSAEHALLIPQHRRLMKVLEEVAEKRRGADGVRGLATAEHL